MHLRQMARLWLVACACVFFASVAFAAPYAAYVIDARTGEVLHSENAEARLHPASLTKMMTLYITFQAIKRGEISLDTQVTVSQNAANEEPSKLGLRAGQKIAVRYLIRAAAVKSANDAATALGEAIGGSEAAFARRMNATAKALGMTKSTFRNAHGLTADGHLSTARDMTILGRHLLYDFPEYYNLFSRRSTDAGGRQVANTNRRFLDAYKGADGIKTGYTRAAGFNLVASAERGSERIIATVFGGSSTAARNAKVAELLDLGFRRAPSKAPLRKPEPPAYVAEAPATPASPGAKRIKVGLAVTASPRPRPRPLRDTEALVAMQASIETAVTAAIAEASKPEAAPDTAAPDTAAGALPLVAALPPPPRPAGLAERLAETAATATADVDVEAEPSADALALAQAEADAVAEAAAEAEIEKQIALAGPEAAPADTPEEAAPAAVVLAEVLAAGEPGADAAPAEAPAPAAADAAASAADPATARLADAAPLPAVPEAAVPAIIAGAPPLAPPARPARPAASAPVEVAMAATTSVAPLPRPVPRPAATGPAPLEVVTRASTSGGRYWAINLGRQPSRYHAEKLLLQTALQEIDTLDEALRKVVPRGGGYEARFVGLSEPQAAKACARLVARGVGCETVGP